MTSVRLRALRRIVDTANAGGDDQRVRSGDVVVDVALDMIEGMGASREDAFKGDAYGRERFHTQCAAVFGLDVGFVAGSPCIVLRRRADKSFGMNMGVDWAPLGQYSLRTSDLEEQVLLRPGAPKFSMSYDPADGATAEVGTGPARTSAAAPTLAWALLAAAVSWYTNDAADRLAREGKRVPPRLVRL